MMHRGQMVDERPSLCIVSSFKMAERIVNVEWQNDDGLRDDLRNYVLQNFKRKEILDFMKIIANALGA